MEIAAIVITHEAASSLFAPRPTGSMPAGASIGSSHGMSAGIGPAASSDATLLRVDDPARAAAGAESGLAAVIDKVRIEYALFRARTQPAAPALTPGSSATPLAQMQQVVSWAMSSQAGVLQAAVGFHAALSASQQSQNAVKTLVEKA